MNERNLVPSPSEMNFGMTESYVDDKHGGMAPGVQIRLAKRFVRPGSKKVTCLAAQTTVPLHDDERASVSNLALKLSDGTNVVLSLSFFEDAEAPAMEAMPVGEAFSAPTLSKPKADWSLGKVLIAMTIGATVGTCLTAINPFVDDDDHTPDIATVSAPAQVQAKSVSHRRRHSMDVPVASVPPPPPVPAAVTVGSGAAVVAASSNLQDHVQAPASAAANTKTVASPGAGIPELSAAATAGTVSKVNVNKSAAAKPALANIDLQKAIADNVKLPTLTIATAAPANSEHKSELNNPMHGWKTFFAAYTKHLSPDKKKSNPLKVAGGLRVPPPPPTPPSVGTYQWQLVATPHVTKTGAVSYMVASTPTIAPNPDSVSIDPKKTSGPANASGSTAKTVETIASKPVVESHGLLPAASAKGEEQGITLIPSASAKSLDAGVSKTAEKIANLSASSLAANRVASAVLAKPIPAAAQAKPLAQPVAMPVVKPAQTMVTVKPVAEPVAKPSPVAPAAKPSAGPTTKPAQAGAPNKPADEPSTKPTQAAAVSKPVAASATKPKQAETVSKSASEPVAKPAKTTKPIAEPVDKSLQAATASKFAAPRSAKPAQAATAGRVVAPRYAKPMQATTAAKFVAPRYAKPTQQAAISRPVTRPVKRAQRSASSRRYRNSNSTNNNGYYYYY